MPDRFANGNQKTTIRQTRLKKLTEAKPVVDTVEILPVSSRT
jgi:hypothetical protein